MTLPYSPDVIALNADVLKSELKAMTGGKPSKYRNAKAEAAGMTFQSGREAAGVGKLILLEEAKQIFGLRLQVRFPLPGGITYVADATYADDSLQFHVVDFKGVRTEGFRIKAKLFRERYGQEIEEL